MINTISTILQILSLVLFLWTIYLLRKENNDLELGIKDAIFCEEIWRETAQNEMKSKHEIGQMLADEQKKVKKLEIENNFLKCREKQITKYHEMLYDKYTKEQTKHKRATKLIRELFLQERGYVKEYQKLYEENRTLNKCIKEQKSGYVSQLRKRDREIANLCDKVRVLETERKYR